MEKIEIQQKTYTPYILLDPNGQIIIKGKSYPENSYSFYEPVIEWIEEFFTKKSKKLIVNFRLEYFNSTTAKIIYDMFDLFEEHKDNVEVKWDYDSYNESIEEFGEELQEDFPTLNIRLEKNE